MRWKHHLGRPSTYRARRGHRAILLAVDGLDRRRFCPVEQIELGPVDENQRSRSLPPLTVNVARDNGFFSQGIGDSHSSDREMRV
jgi:hypothetical protein